MKSTHPKILLLGNNAGNNLGDAAILAAVMETLTKELPNVEFIVPSTNPGFIRKNYGHIYNVKAIDVMPWTLSLRLFGLPTIYQMLKCDAALICDGIIFGKKLWNPAFNFLITLIALLPFAKLLNCKMVCYSCGIGPFPGFWSKHFARWLINGCSLVMMRERDSIQLAKEIGVTKQMELTGDAAFLNLVEQPECGMQILAETGVSTEKPLFGINITKYMDGWLYGQGERVGNADAFIERLAQGIQLANQKLDGAFTPVLFSTHPMDEAVSDILADKLQAKVIKNSKYLSHEIQSVMLKCELFMGMRFHSLILASAVYAPIIGLIYAPKVRGYMRLLDCEELGLELAKVTPELLADTIVKAWHERKLIKNQQKNIIDELKAAARKASRLLRETIYPEMK